MRARLPVLLLLLTFGVVPLAGRTAPLVWTLSGVTFNDGGTASGFFTFDASTLTYSGIAVATTAGTTRGAASYAFSSPVSDATTLLMFTTNPASDQTGLPAFGLAFGSSLTNAGGTSSIVGSIEATCTTATCIGNPPTTQRFVTAGSVTTLSVPAMPPWLMAATTLLVGLIALSMLRRRTPAVA